MWIDRQMAGRPADPWVAVALDGLPLALSTVDGYNQRVAGVREAFAVRHAAADRPPVRASTSETSSAPSSTAAAATASPMADAGPLNDFERRQQIPVWFAP